MSWTAWWKGLLVPLGVSLVGAAVSPFFFLYGLPALVMAAGAFAVLVLVLFLADLHRRVEYLEAYGEEWTYEPPRGAERERLRAQLKEQLKEIPELRKLEEPLRGADRTRVMNWHQKTLHLLDRALGPHSWEYERLEMNNYEPSFGAILLSGTPLQRGLDRAESILRAVLEVELEE